MTRAFPIFLLVVMALAMGCEREPARVRFQLDPSIATTIVGAEPLFGPLDEVRAAHVDGAPDLSTWFMVETKTPLAVERELRARGATEISYEPKAEPAAFSLDDGPSCPVKTPPYDDKQGYRRALDINAAWELPGGRGEGMSFADIEGEWNDTHEDLPGDRIRHVAGTRQRTAQWRAHGTAVLGVIASRENGVGMLGLAPDVDEIITASLGRIGPARAFYEAAKALEPGDVMIIELHGPGPNSRGRGQQGYVPMEWWQPEYDAIKWATSKGIIVVEAGGNGSEDLDAKIYKGKFDRRVRDSGAILVGAGAPDQRTRLGFSNYGSRVDVHGWGMLVATLDYGDLQGCSQHDRKYTARFGGTSSASPVVAGAVIAIQGVHKKARGRVLTPLEMRELLVATGTPQVGPQHIGPIPNVRRALDTFAGAGPAQR